LHGGGGAESFSRISMLEEELTGNGRRGNGEIDWLEKL